ncbi:zinc finger MYM-type protein 1 [Trichonephila clavipes]|nr:zinc finger MYM-type protein 1 [Trichonephila clavipes]
MEQINKNITYVGTLASERERNLAIENGETQQTNINDENMQDLDDQQPSEKDNFGGTEEVFGSPHNGNFIGALELLAEFDPFIREHTEQRELRPKSLISYLSKQYMSK